MPVKKKTKRILKVGREDASGLSSFVERPVPTVNEVANFERVIGRELREQEIDSNLDEIYSDPRGKRVNVKKMRIKKRPTFLFRFFRSLLILGLLVLIGYFSYFYLFTNSNDISSLDFNITSPEKVLAGQSFFYDVTYHNPTRYAFTKLHLELQYPENFIFSSASLAPTSGDSTWNLSDLKAGATFTLRIYGQLIASPNSANVIFGHLSYLPSSFTSQFKKDASFSTLISGLGFNVNLNSSATAFIGQNNDLTLVFSNIKSNHLGDFNIVFSLPPHTNASVILNKSGSYSVSSPVPSQSSSSSSITTNSSNLASSSSSKNNSLQKTPSSTRLVVTSDGGVNWQVADLYPPLGRQEIPLVYKISRIINQPAITVRLEKRIKTGKVYVFWKKTIKPQLIKSDLNLTLKLNGSKDDGTVNFGQALDYSLSYSNQSVNTYHNVVLMAVAKGDLLDWSSIQADNNGKIKNQAIVWTKNELSNLATIKPGDSGTLKFSLKLSPFNTADLGQNLSILSYGQYSMNDQPISSDSNKSNTINDQINSDLTLNEQIRYFDFNNLPAGSGPLPPVVGQTTTFRVYWTVKNNLHQLTDTKVVLNLPSYVSWAGNNNTKVGSLYYNSANHQVIWVIGRLPLSVAEAKASFNISITPTEANLNKILVLSPGSTVSAMDSVTTALIKKTTSPKTTKLEDDHVASLNNSGIIR